jgi:hypothetical protein
MDNFSSVHFFIYWLSPFGLMTGQEFLAETVYILRAVGSNMHANKWTMF